jgi:hypothetical protein
MSGKKFPTQQEAPLYFIKKSNFASKVWVSEMAVTSKLTKLFGRDQAYET